MRLTKSYSVSYNLISLRLLFRTKALCSPGLDAHIGSRALHYRTHLKPQAHLFNKPPTKVEESIHSKPTKMSEKEPQRIETSVNETAESLKELCVQEKKPKQRKAQSEEEYLEQKKQFETSGPHINTDTWLHDEKILSNLDSTKKIDRVHILQACEKSYFMQDYDKCLELIKTGEGLFGVELDDETANDDLKTEFQNAGKKTRKSTKVERHVVELLHIKEACLKKLDRA